MLLKPVFDVGSVTEPQPVDMDFLLKNGIEDGLVERRRIEIKTADGEWNTLKEVGITDPKINWNWKNTKFKYPTDEKTIYSSISCNYSYRSRM
jgi:hypothetical protein